jgi:hypothetical protein
MYTRDLPEWQRRQPVGRHGVKIYGPTQIPCPRTLHHRLHHNDRRNVHLISGRHCWDGVGLEPAALGNCDVMRFRESSTLVQVQRAASFYAVLRLGPAHLGMTTRYKVEHPTVDSTRLNTLDPGSSYEDALEHQTNIKSCRSLKASSSRRGVCADVEHQQRLNHRFLTIQRMSKENEYSKSTPFAGSSTSLDNEVVVLTRL